MLKASELLERAKAKISNPENWVQGTYAQNAEGKRVGFSEYSACKFCTEGALLRAYVDEDSGFVTEEQIRAMNVLNKVVGHVPSWNDAPERKHGEVMEMFGLAIGIAKVEEA